MSRGSNELEAIMVKITTEAKATAPTPGSMVAISFRFTNATRIEIMKMSTIGLARKTLQGKKVVV